MHKADLVIDFEEKTEDQVLLIVMDYLIALLQVFVEMQETEAKEKVVSYDYVINKVYSPLH